MQVATSLRIVKAPSSILRNLSHTTPIRSIATPNPRPFSTGVRRPSSMTAAVFKHIDPASYVQSDEAFVKPWGKVDGPGYSFKLTDRDRSVQDIRGREREYNVNNAGFAVYKYPATEKSFTDEAKIQEEYYPEVEALLREKLPGVKKVVFFDHTIRRREKASPRQPVQQVHVDQTPKAAEVRVRRHLPADEVEELLKGRYQIINVWRPIANPASDFPLAVVDYRSTKPEDLVKVDLLYPKRAADDDGEDRGKEAFPDPTSETSTVGYEVKGETFAVRPSENHKFMYMKDITPDEVMFLKCFDSYSEVNGGQKGVAAYSPHTAFVDPQTPKDAPGRQSIEVRSLVFYE